MNMSLTIAMIIYQAFFCDPCRVADTATEPGAIIPPSVSVVTCVESMKSMIQIALGLGFRVIHNDMLWQTYKFETCVT